MHVLENVPLAPYTTLGVGGPARWLVETGDEPTMIAALHLARSHGVPCFVLGGGSNLLVSDHGFPGLVLHLTGAATHFTDENNGFATITASAGADWDSIVRLAIDNNCAGIECLAGIPGSVGGTPVQNVGAYGQEVSTTITRVRALDLGEQRFVDLSPADCHFAYRRSIFNSTHRGRYAITRVSYSLHIDGLPHIEYRDVRQYFAERAVSHPTLAETATAVRLIRARKGMLLDDRDPDTRSAGSFFKNPIIPVAGLPHLALLAACTPEQVPQFPAGLEYTPADARVKLSAAWLIELAGFRKGFSLGRAGLSAKHVLAVVNRGNATAADIVVLRDLIVSEVAKRTGIQLEQEPVTLGFPPAR